MISNVIYVLPDNVTEEEPMTSENFMSVKTLLSLNDLSEYFKNTNGEKSSVNVRFTLDRNGHLIMQYL